MQKPSASSTEPSSKTADPTLRPADREQLTHRAVSFQVRQLEPFLAWTLAGFTLWSALVYQPPGLGIWLLALFALCIGSWSKLAPAQHQGLMFGRAVLLALSAVLLQQSVSGIGPAGPHFLWLLLVVLYYSLLLSTVWALPLAALAVCAYVLCCALAQEPLPWRLALLNGGFLVLTAGLSIQFGKQLLASDEQAEAALRDGRSMLYNEAGFFVHGAVLLENCRKSAQPCSMVLLSGKDLRDIPSLLGHRAANALFARAVQAVGAIPGNGIAARTESLEFALLLPNVSAERAAALIKRRLGDPPQLAVKFNDRPLVIVLDMAIAQARSKEQTIEKLYDKLHRSWAEKSAQQLAANKPDLLLDVEEGKAGERRLAASPTVPMPLPAHMRMKRH
jgi:GGDEF domain-containing protein